VLPPLDPHRFRKAIAERVDCDGNENHRVEVTSRLVGQIRQEPCLERQVYSVPGGVVGFIQSIGKFQYSMSQQGHLPCKIFSQ
jgi:hypothetical protein